MRGDAESSSRRPAALAISLAAGVVGALALRLWGHARYLHDPESLMVPTVGRELGHGHWGEAIRYQYNLIQGGILFDGGLAAIGFRLFGDGLLAWKWYALAYGALAAVLGMLILKRTAGTAGMVLWPLLLIAAPFVIKDGLITPAGHHSSGFVWALGALAVALGGDTERPGWKRGLAAGLLLGAGMFYMRTAVSAGPAIAIALLRGGWKPLAAGGVGTLALPGLAAGSAAAFVAGGSPYREWGLAETLRILLWAPRAARTDIEYLPKLVEALSWSLRDLVFAQAELPTGGPEPLAVMDAAGLLWAASWLVTPALLGGLAVLLILRRRGGSEAAAAQLWGTAVIAALVAGYVATYVLSPFRIDPFLLEASDGKRFAPGLSGPRYVLPAWFALTVGLAHVLGTGLGGPRVRYGAGAAAAALLGLGITSAGLDVAMHREPAGTWATLRPYEYYKMFGPNRGPGLDDHVSCTRGDPISRANHLRAAGGFVLPGLQELTQNPDALRQTVEQVRDGRPILDAEMPFVLHGMGLGLGDQLHTANGLEVKRSLDAALRAANALEDEEQGEAFLAGFATGFPQDRLREGLNDSFLERACLPTRYGSIRPLCSRVGAAAMDPPNTALPDLPYGMFPDLPNPLIDGPWGRELVRGAGRRLALDAPWLAPEIARRESGQERGIVLWSPSLADAFVEGWTEGTTELYWTDADPWIPTLVP